MPSFFPRGAPSPRMLFVLQLGIGTAAGLGTILGLTVINGAKVAASSIVFAVCAWLVLCLTAAFALERRKPFAQTQSPTAWAQHVRELRDSRLEIVNAFEIERRRLERDLHDGAQQYLVASSIKIGEAMLLLTTAKPNAYQQVNELLASAQDTTDEALRALRATVTGIHPTVLSDRGLEAAVREITTRSPQQVVVRVPHPLPPIPQGVAATVYFLVSEAITNATKHAPDAQVTVLLHADEQLHVSIVDDGPGGAAIQSGRGLAGMTERLAAFGGVFHLASPQGGPTSITARIPLLLAAGTPGVVMEASDPVGKARP